MSGKEKKVVLNSNLSAKGVVRSKHCCGYVEVDWEPGRDIDFLPDQKLIKIGWESGHPIPLIHSFISIF